ncbi:16572_t:CDS:2, partial [Funneliformis caledonium]
SNEIAIYGEHEIKILEWREAKLLLKNYQEFNFINGWRRIFTSSQFLTLYPNLSKILDKPLKDS